MFMGMGEQPIGGENPMGAVIGGAGNRKGAGFGWWWHTPDDTLDKMDPDLLVRDTRVYVHALWRLLTDRVLPLDYGRQAEVLRGELKALEAGLGGRIDLGPILERVDVLRRLGAALKAKAAEGGAASANRALMRTSRALVPVDYTRGDRFDHDPALSQTAYPVLDPVRRLAATRAGSDEANFAAVGARRALNRVAFALDEANTALEAGA
jgi:N-acetylated-alpha-linked acidic dipeptidase